ncbi:MAG: class I SAM-dependent methyltransferase [Leptolyngbyaceae cyanobacterium SM1_3_5]|nr:class I SAM-dependent methyltransferase [Leptolyngbyaceae cyanobacterium SM1_3_5]
MAEHPYIFTNSQEVSELERLQAIEQIFDSATHKQIQATGISQNWCCLEVGAGAGSIMRWMSSIVGEGGKVVAVDLDTRFIENIHLANVEILKADIRQLQLEENSFDLIHARYVLIHISDYESTLSKMIALLKPGGWIVIEEPDFSAARAIAGSEAACQAVNRVNRAIFKTFKSRKMDYDLGIKLPALFQKLGLELQSVENNSPLSNGSSGVARMMKMSALQLLEKYIATGEATQKDIEQYCLFAEDQTAWAIYYATVGVTAQKVIS